MPLAGGRLTGEGMLNSLLEKIAAGEGERERLFRGAGAGFRVIKQLFTVLAIASIAYFLFRAWQAAPDDFSFRPHPLLALSVLALAVAHALSAVSARQILRSVGAEVGYLALLKTHVARLPARYLPGGVWHTVGRAVDLRAQGVSAAILFRLVVLENVYAIGVALLLGGGVLCLLQASGPSATQLHCWVALAALFGLALAPVILGWVFARSGRWPTLAAAAIGCASFALTWSAYAMAFTAYMQAFALTGPADSLLRIAGAYLFSWGIGLIAFFAPQGIGIFEGGIAELLRPDAVANGVAIAFGFRICMAVTDLLLWLVGGLLLRRFAKNEDKAG